MVLGFWQVSPDLFAGECKDWSKYQSHIAQDAVDSGLSCTSGYRVWFFNIQSVLDNIQIEVGQVDGAEVADCIINQMELKLIISFVAFFCNLIHSCQSPAIQFFQLIVRNRIGIWVKVIKVTQNITCGVADLSVNFRKLF